MKDLMIKIKSKYLLVLLLPLALALTSCGGDSDSAPIIPPADTIMDTTAPTLVLTGDASLTIFQNTTYSDSGATANDAIDGAITVEVVGDVNEAVVGDYVLTYTATDIAGNVSTVTRTVTVTPMVLSGTAAGGAAIVGTVVVKGANGNVKSSVIEADGSYEVDVTGLAAPYRLRAEGTVGGKQYKLHSYTAEASVDGTVNITPFTDLIIANTAQQLAENFFDSNADTSLDPAELSAQEDALQAKLQNVFDALGLDTAINLLSSSFSADHSGVDAALDLISIETGDNNIATITNLLDGSSITDDITQADDNDTIIVVDTGGVETAVTDTVAISNLFAAFTSAFSEGLPAEATITDYFNADFINADESLAEFFTNIRTDPGMIGVEFISLSVNNLDSTAGTAMVSFTVVFGGVVDAESQQWFVAKHDTLGWQLLGDQQIVDLNKFGYHCNDYNSSENSIGACGINTSFWDNDVDNNGTNGEPILSASVSVIGVDGVVKDMFYIGTPNDGSDGSIYNEGQQKYTWDWREFGTAAGTIDPSIFSVGDTIEYNLYQANLDLNDPTSPTVVGESLATYTTSINHKPQTVGKYPSVTQATLSNMENFTPDEDITIGWELVDGTRIDEILVQIDDAKGGFVLQVWEEDFSDPTATSVTIDKAMFDEELLGNDSFDPTNGYTVTVRIYAADEVTSQTHSRDYRIIVDAYVAPAPLTCGYESGWDDLADFELGAPINPNSFAEFNEVVDDCGGTIVITKATFTGTAWIDVDIEDNSVENTVFNNDGSATKVAPSTGQFMTEEDNGTISEEIDFTWYIDTVGESTYIVIETDSTVDSDLPDGFWIRETRAITSVTGTLGVTGAIYEMTIYTEQSNYSDTDRAVGTDAEIWNSVETVK